MITMLVLHTRQAAPDRQIDALVKVRENILMIFLTEIGLTEHTFYRKPDIIQQGM